MINLIDALSQIFWWAGVIALAMVIFVAGIFFAIQCLCWYIDYLRRKEGKAIMEKHLGMEGLVDDDPV